MNFFYFLLVIYLAMFSLVSADNDLNLGEFIAQQEKKHEVTVGLAVTNLQDNHLFVYNPREKFPLASVIKLPIALALMHKVEAGTLNLNTKLDVQPYDLVPGSGYLGYYLTHNGIKISVFDLLESMLAVSDNTATDILLNYIGGPSYVQKYLIENGIDNLFVNRYIMQFYIDGEGLDSIPPKKERNLKNIVEALDNVPDELRMNAAVKFYSDPKDTSTPLAMDKLLTKLANYQLLNEKNSEILLEIMSHTISKNRLKYALPDEWCLANKTGSWYYRTKSFSYCNDVGIITKDDDQQFAVTVFVKSKASKDFTNDCKVIDNIAEYLYSFYMK